MNWYRLPIPIPVWARAMVRLDHSISTEKGRFKDRRVQRRTANRRVQDQAVVCLLVMVSFVAACRRDSTSEPSAAVNSGGNRAQQPSLSEPRLDASLARQEPRPPNSETGPEIRRDASDMRREVETLHQEELQVAQRFQRDFPGQGDAEGLLGSVYLNQGRSADAIECWQRCLQKEPRRLEAYDALALVAFQQGEYERVVELAGQMLAIDPELPGVRSRLARALLGLGRTEEAVERLQQELRLNPQSADSFFLLGRAHAQAGQDQEAYASLARAIELEPNHPQACYQMAAVCQRLDRLKEAEQYRQQFQSLQTAARIEVQGRKGRDSELVDLQSVRRSVAMTEAVAAGLYLRRGNRSRAGELLQRAIELDPENARLHIDFGVLLAQAGQLSAAEQSFRKAIQVAPENSVGYEQLAKAYLSQRKQMAEAEELAETAARMSPTGANHYLLARARYEAGNARGALEAIERALRIEPENLEYRKVRAMLKQGQ